MISGAQLADIQAWSELEKDTATILLAEQTIVEIGCQGPTVDYEDDDGVQHTHRFDFWARLIDGSLVVYNIKYTDQLESVKVLFGHLAKQKWPFKIICLTECQATHGRADNAASILDARENFNAADYLEALEVVSALDGHVLFHSLLCGARNEGDRRAAMWSLIDNGVLVIENHLERLADYDHVIIDREVLAEELSRYERR